MRIECNLCFYDISLCLWCLKYSKVTNTMWKIQLWLIKDINFAISLCVLHHWISGTVVYKYLVDIESWHFPLHLHPWGWPFCRNGLLTPWWKGPVDLFLHKTIYYTTVYTQSAFLRQTPCIYKFCFSKNHTVSNFKSKPRNSYHWFIWSFASFFHDRVPSN